MTELEKRELVKKEITNLKTEGADIQNGIDNLTTRKIINEEKLRSLRILLSKKAYKLR